ncbi:hypothetical protein J7E96_35325 [Streptomyces sp. ISL-96]|uniref:DUF6907 domain-containing protein n=1 Tax=Streptomyces sp. ISL-96 TaxID=2819191 RepID=UPI001BE70DF6|nr:hypothetical protein [Streptomyces sp. ISL-96]MBT2493683.1 hypothetical protein [Streptomyces sp. ISL-96]
MKTYTGPTLGGATATVECPDWCVTDHAYWDDRVDDMFHHSAPIEITPPKDPAPLAGRPLVPQLEADLMLHSTDPRPCAASVYLRLDEHNNRAVDLDVPGVDKLLAELDRYRAGLVLMRERLAAIHAERTRR